MKREFSCRVYLNRSEMNAAQYQLGKVGVKTLPQLFRFALEKIDVNLADQVLDYETRIANLNRVNTSLREKIKTGDNTVELHKRDSEKWERLFDEKFELYSGGMRVFQERAEEAEKLLREKIEAYEKEVAVVDALRLEFDTISERADEFEKLLYDQKTKYDECHEERVKYREVIRGVAEVIGWDGDALWIVADPIKIGRQSVAEVIGWNGDALDTFALRVQEIKTERDKYRPAYDFLCHELGLRNNEVYDEKHFTSEFEKLFAILEDEQDAHLRIGLRLENIFARYNNASRTLNEMPPETVSFWERIKRLFRRKS